MIYAMGGGLQRICKMYGQMTVEDTEGNEVVWYWDYHKDEAVREEDFTHERRTLSEKAKWLLKKQKK